MRNKPFPNPLKGGSRMFKVSSPQWNLREFFLIKLSLAKLTELKVVTYKGCLSLYVITLNYC
jgi:hypothetical protein